MIEYNKFIEWTDKDRRRGECPVPDGTDTTVWLKSGEAYRDESPQDWDWGYDVTPCITSYLIHQPKPAPCPFCGCETVLAGCGGGAVKPYVLCKRCEANGPYGDTADEVIKAWNKVAKK